MKQPCLLWLFLGEDLGWRSGDFSPCRRNKILGVPCLVQPVLVVATGERPHFWRWHSSLPEGSSSMTQTGGAGEPSQRCHIQEWSVILSSGSGDYIQTAAQDPTGSSAWTMEIYFLTILQDEVWQQGAHMFGSFEATLLGLQMEPSCCSFHDLAFGHRQPWVSVCPNSLFLKIILCF